MKIAMRIPLVRALNESISKGFVHQNDGSTAVPAASPLATLTSATTAKMPRVTISKLSSTTWVRADSSMPMQQIAVITASQATPTAVTAAVELAALSQSTSRKVYLPAIWARLAMTMMSATTIAQPPSQPAHGPMALDRKSVV